MKQEIKEIFERFEGDITSGAVYLYLLTLFNANERQLISLVEVGRKTGLSPKRLKSILSRLTEMKLIETFLRPKRGYEVGLLETNVLRHETNVLRHETDVPRHSTDVSRHKTDVSCLTNLPPYISSERSGDDIQKPKASSHNLNLTTQTKAKLESSVTSARKPRTEDPRLEEIRELWNRTVKGTEIPAIRKLGKDRKRKLAEHLKEEPELKFWQKVFEKVIESSFLTGSNDRGWKADFDFILQKGKPNQIYEGKYAQSKNKTDPNKKSVHFGKQDWSSDRLPF